MQRVTSRQRLFSWDQFDATADCPSSSDEESDYITCLGASSRNTSFALDNDDDYYHEYDSTCADLKLLQANKSGNEGILITPRGLSTPPVVTPLPCNDTLPSLMTEIDTLSSIKRTNANGTTIQKSVSFSNLIIANKKEVLCNKDLSPRSSIHKCHCGNNISNTHTLKATVSSTPVLTLLNLNCDTQFDLLSFLSAEEVQCVGMTCHYFNNMLLAVGSSLLPNEQTSSVVRNTIWWSLMKEKWPHLPLMLHGTDTNADNDVDDCAVRMTPTKTILPSTQIIFTDNRSTATASREKMNFGALLKQAPTDMPPSKIDSRFYVTPLLASSFPIPTSTAAQIPTLPTTPPPMGHQPNTSFPQPSFTDAIAANQKQPFTCYEMETSFFSNLRLGSQTNRNTDEDELKLQPHQQGQKELKHHKEQTGAMEETIQVIQFTGAVGTGDRSVRADQPFPLPLKSISVFKPLSPSHLEQGNDTEIHPLVINNTNNKNNNEVIKNINNTGISSGNTSRVTNRRRKRKERKVPSSHFPMSPFSSSNVVVPSPKRAFLEMLERGRKCRARCFCAVVATCPAADSLVKHNKGESHSSTSTAKNTAEVTRSIPFVSPFVVVDPRIVIGERGHQRFAEIDLTPRMVAYFEVSILLRDKMQEPDINEIGQSTTTATPRMMFPHHHNADSNLEQQQNQRRHVSECVAIGLSLQSSNSRMPGWDKQSYGFHGDDGGIFHSRGEMIRAYGPKYGEGDTVGCGVNYDNGGIFFTLNGNFLGYAWCSLGVVREGNTSLYPTVGVDSNCPLVSNFGNTRPFIFDLAGFVASQGSVPTHTT